MQVKPSLRAIVAADAMSTVGQHRLSQSRDEKGVITIMEATLNEMRVILRDFPGPDLEAGAAAAAREKMLTKPAGALGRLEELTQWLSVWQGRHPPILHHPRTAVFAGNHGVTAQGVSAYPASVTAQMVQNFIDGGAAVNQLVAGIDGDLRVYELALDQPTADFTTGPAMDEEQCAKAIAYGMMAVEPGIDILALGEMGIGNTTSASALCLALFGGRAIEWTGPGTGVEGAVLRHKADVVAKAVEANRAGMTDPFEILRCVGGLELSAIVGAVIAARLARTPVILDGFACTAAAAILFAIDPSTLDHCIVAHRSAEPGHTRLLEKIDKAPLLDLGMRLGEGSGATLAISLLKGAVACHNGMATFDDASVSRRID